jgi:hypothetical protein
MPAPKGSRNRHNGKVWKEALERALSRYSNSSVAAGLDILATRMVKAAAEGDEEAFDRIVEKIADRFDGKPSQSMDVTGEIEVSRLVIKE